MIRYLGISYDPWSIFPIKDGHQCPNGTVVKGTQKSYIFHLDELKG